MSRATRRESESLTIRYIMLMAVHPMFWRPSGEIFREVLDDYGSTDERQLWRALRWLKQNKLIIACGKAQGCTREYRRTYRGRRMLEREYGALPR